MKKRKELIPLILLAIMLINASTTWAQEHNPEERYYQGVAAAEYGEHEKALALFSQLIATEGAYEDVYYQRGMVYLETGQTDKAIADLLKDEEKEHGRSSLLLAKAYARKGETGKAVKWLERHLNSHRYRVEISQINSDEDLQKLNKTKAWKELWDKNHYTRYDELGTEVKFEMNNGNDMVALELVNEALEERKHAHQLYALRSWAYEQTGDMDYALEDIEEAISLRGNYRPYLYRKAKLAIELGKERLALQTIDRAIRNEPQDLKLLVIRARIYMENEEYEKARNDLDLYLKYFYKDTEALALKSELAYREGDVYEALRSVNKVIATDSTQYGLFVHRSKLYESSGNLDRAISDLSWAIELEPRNGELYVQRGKLLLKRGDKAHACNDWEKASRYGAKEGGQLHTRHCY